MNAMKVDDVARALNISPTTVRNQIKAGNIPAFYVGRCLRIWPQYLDSIGARPHDPTRSAPKEETLCLSGSETGYGISTSPLPAASELDVLLERLTAKPRRNTTTASKSSSGKSSGSARAQGGRGTKLR